MPPITPITPCYIFDIDRLRESCRIIRERAQRAGIGLCYAVKANGYLTPYMLEFTKALEVCSHGELKLCKKQGIPMDRVILSGVNKEEEFIRDGIQWGVGIITAESASHFENIVRYANLYDQKVRVILRLSCGAQFGMDREVLEGIVSRRDSYENIVLEGIHYFTGTNKKKLSKIIRELELCYELIKDLREAYGYEVRLLEYGPGLSVPYFAGDDFENPYELYQQVLDWISQNPKPNEDLAITLEMGRFFAAACGSYESTVADVKQNGDLKVCIIDGGKNHLSYYGQNMALKTPLITHIPLGGKAFIERSVSDQGGVPEGNRAGTFEGSESSDSSLKGEDNWTIFGSLCSFNDIIARDVPFKSLSIGDRLIFHNTGAYSVTEGLYLFLSRPFPRIYIKEDQALKLIRDYRESFELNG